MGQKHTNSHELTMPVVAARGVVAFPKAMIHLEIARFKSILAIEKSIQTDKKIFVVTKKNPEQDHPGEQDLYTVGTVVEVRQFQRFGEEYHLSGVGLYRARWKEVQTEGEYLTATAVRLTERRTLNAPPDELEALMRSLRVYFTKYAFAMKRVSKELATAVEQETDPLTLFQMMSSCIPFRFDKKQAMLEESDHWTRMHMLLQAMAEEAEIATLERRLMDKVESVMDQNQRDYFLREQVRVIQEELGANESVFGDPEEYIKQIRGIVHLTPEGKEKLEGEVNRLFRMPDNSHEAYVISSYLDTVLSLPWDAMRKEPFTVDGAEEQLEKDHYGLKKVKERILENLAVRQFNPNVKGQILCFVGPPGIGKTSISQSIAKAIHRDFVRISLGGVNDEADIRGHRKTYIGAMPGRIISGLMQAKTRNPVILLDEIDKMASSYRGDPSSAMLEVLDAEQNNTFTDHYIEVPYDLSDCFFIATANHIGHIPAPLLDRMEVIEITSYTLEEKFQIAKRHLIPKLRASHGITKGQAQISDDAIYLLIDSYTRESGVRNLERMLSSLFRKAARKLAEGTAKVVRFTGKNLENYLGPFRYLGEQIPEENPVGLVNGLAWTSVGGELLQIEASILDGKGVVQLTGNLGNVMKESANTAISYVRSVTKEYGIDPDFYQNKDIHIHAPEGAVPKDGPSAGIALVIVLISALTNIPIRRNVAMTGEVTLRGRVLPIGGLKEKLIAAYKSGVKTVFIPKENERDLSELDSNVREALTIISCGTVDEVIRAALLFPVFHKKESAGMMSARTVKSLPADHPKAEV